jgi:FkbM family methyltransferase
MATVEDLRSCYRLLLGREPDEAGFRGYLPYVNVRPTPVDELVGSFISSVEFRRRLATTFGWSTGAPEAVDLLSGYRIYLRSDDPGMAVVKVDRDYEPHVSGRMRSLLEPGATMVDVGASFGFFTVLAGRKVGPAGRVIACEPGRQNQSVLLLNLVANNLDNVVVHPVAVSDAAGVLLYSPAGANGAVSAFDGNPELLASNDLVAARTLDELLVAEQRVDVIKVDVEGAEGRVFRGAKATLERFRPAIFFEFSPASLEASSGVDAWSLLDMLASYGYAFELLAASEPEGRRRSPDELLSHFGSEDRDHLDLLAVPG